MELIMSVISGEKTSLGKPEARSYDLTVADAVWIGTALRQRTAGIKNRDKGFATEDIVDEVVRLRLTKGAYKSIWQHVNQHCVANRKPQPNRSRMLFALGGGVRRLFRESDSSDPGREGAPTHPEWSKLPVEYQDLMKWYEEEWNGAAAGAERDPLLALIGSGKDIWKDEHADEYVARLRSDWGDRA
jgi:hypothetical protein